MPLRKQLRERLNQLYKEKTMGSVGTSNSGSSTISEGTSYEDIQTYLSNSNVIEITDTDGNTVRYAKGTPQVINSYFDKSEGGPSFANVNVHEWTAESSHRGTMVLNKTYSVSDLAGIASRRLNGKYGMPKDWKSIKRIK